jgi:hypothetical protein
MRKRLFFSLLIVPPENPVCGELCNECRAVALTTPASDIEKPLAEMELTL